MSDGNGDLPDEALDEVIAGRVVPFATLSAARTAAPCDYGEEECGKPTYFVLDMAVAHDPESLERFPDADEKDGLVATFHLCRPHLDDVVTKLVDALAAKLPVP